MNPATNWLGMDAHANTIAMLANIIARQDPHAAQQQETVRLDWKTGTPEVPQGGREVFWCATRNRGGKVFYRHLAYLNGYVMQLSDSQDDPGDDAADPLDGLGDFLGGEPLLLDAVPVGDDGDYAWTGWYEESCDQCETQWRFMDEIVQWMRLPRAAIDQARTP
jgi:hypothetical protein